MTVRDIIGRLRRVKKCRGGYTALCPAHHDRRRSLSIAEGKDGRVLFKCHAGCEVERICRALGIEMSDLFCDDVRKSSRTARNVVDRYDYCDETSALVFQVCRTDPKGFFQRRPDGAGGWINNLNGVRPVLYHLPEVVAAEQVLVVEGEKDADTAYTLGFVATTNSGGAGKWCDQHSEFLRSKHVVIIPDADEPGRKHAQHVAASLINKAASLKVFEMPSGKDLSEWSERGGTREQFEKLVAVAPKWAPPDGGSLLVEIAAFFQRYVSVTDAQAAIVALWVLHTHAFDAAEATAYLAFVSAGKGCGKTRSLEGLSVLVFNPWLTGRVTAAVLVRKIHAQRTHTARSNPSVPIAGVEGRTESFRVIFISFKCGVSLV